MTRANVNFKLKNRRQIPSKAAFIGENKMQNTNNG
jgi:hypothetical protein